MTSSTGNIKNDSIKCGFLVVMLILSSALLFFLNFYIGYEIILQFKGDGWSFLGGLFIAAIYIITIPANVFSILSIKWVRQDKKYKFYVPVALGIIGTLAGFILYNAFEYWIFVVAFCVLLLASYVVCSHSNKQSKSNDSKVKTTTKTPVDSTITTFKKIKAIQIVGLFLLLPIIIGTVISPDISVPVKILILLLLGIHVFITLAFFKKRSWAIKAKYIESHILGGVTVFMFIAFVITDGISLTNSSFAMLFFFILLAALFVYLILSYKKLSKSGLFSVFIFMVTLLGVLVTNSVTAQESNPIKEIYLLDKNDFNPYVEFASSDITDFFNPQESSRYPSTNLFDGYLKTCWVAGNTQTNKTSLLYIKVSDKIDLDKVILTIFSGYGKSKVLFNANARPNQLKISLFAGFYPEGWSTEVANLYLVKQFSVDTIQLADTFGVQSFPLPINKSTFSSFQKETKEECKRFSGKEYNRLSYTEHPNLIPSLILKIEILSSYPGTRYDDVCISEIIFNDRFVTHSPSSYKEIERVYIKNDHTLLADYKNEKGVVILKDTTSIFTLVEYPKHSNWAVLHYVPNSSVGQGSRIEELYALIDLKNKKIVTKELENCTGQHTLSIEKKDDGKCFLMTTEDQYKIELK